VPRRRASVCAFSTASESSLRVVLAMMSHLLKNVPMTMMRSWGSDPSMADHGATASARRPRGK